MLESNQEEIERLTEDLGQNSLAKSKVFADFIVVDPSIIYNDNRLNALLEDLQVSEPM